MTMRRLISGFTAGLIVISVAGCSGDSDGDRVAELEAQIASLEAQLAAAEQQAAATPPAVEESGTTVSAVAPEVTRLDTYGFTLLVPEGLDVTATGVGGEEAASVDAGELSATDGAVAMVLLWTTDETTPEEAVAGAFELVRAASSDLEFVPTNQGMIALSDSEGAFGAFQAERDGAEAGVGIAGGWRCDGRIFSLTVLGADAGAVEAAFAGLVGGFGCEG